MDLSDIVIVAKESKVEYDCRTQGVDRSVLLRQYEREHVDIGNLLRAHEAQVNSRDIFGSVFDGVRFLCHYDFTRDTGAKAVIVLGGDDTFKQVSHYVDGGLLVGVNSDPLRSAGALLEFNYTHAERLRWMLLHDSFLVKEWTRIDAVVNGRFVGRAVSEVYLGADRRVKTSRMQVALPGRELPVKGSGLLVATGCGVSGWYRSAYGVRVLDKSERCLVWLMTEPYRDSLHNSVDHDGVVDELTVYSTMNACGIVSVDCVDGHEAAFNRGSVANLRVSDSPLRVVCG